MRKMMPMKRWPSEALNDFMHRLGNKVKAVKNASGFQDQESIYLQSLFSWAGHLARLRDYDPDRITTLVPQYRNCT